MKKIKANFIFLVLLIFCSYSYADDIFTCFSPNGDCTKRIVTTINNAKQEILVQAYVFTSTSIAEALIKAHRKGIKVEIIMDGKESKGKYSLINMFKEANMTVFTDHDHSINHNKVMIIDDKILLTGSFNFTKAAETKNAENLIFVYANDRAVRLYKENFELHKSHSNEYIKPRH